MAIEVVGRVDYSTFVEPALFRQVKLLGPSSEAAGPLFGQMSRQLHVNAIKAGIQISY